MTTAPISAVLVAAAVLLAPGPSRHRVPGLSGRRSDGRRTVVPAATLAASVVAASVSWALLLVGLMLAVVGAVWRRRRESDQRRRAQGQAMASALEVLIGELRVGAHPVHAFSTAASESSGVVGVSLHQVAARAGLGADVSAGLAAAAADSAVPTYWRRLAVFWELAAQRGLAMSVLMQAAHRDIVDRQRFSDRIRAELAGARATAAILAALPALGVLLGHMIGAHPLRFLLGGGVGGVLLVVGVGLIAVGLAWADRIIERLLP